MDVLVQAVAILVFGLHGGVQAREEEVEGSFEDHLPDHVAEAPGHHVLPEEAFEGGEGRLGHPPEAILDAPLPPL